MGRKFDGLEWHLVFIVRVSRLIGLQILAIIDELGVATVNYHIFIEGLSKEFTGQLHMADPEEWGHR